jgi:cell division protein FtsX
MTNAPSAPRSRTRLIVATAMITVVAMLAVAGTAWLVVTRLRGDDPAPIPTAGLPDIVVFIEPKATTAQDAVVFNYLARSELVEQALHYGQDDALAEFRCLFADRPVMLDGISADALPSSYRVHLRSSEDGTNLERVTADLRSLPGVREVQQPLAATRSGVTQPDQPDVGGPRFGDHDRCGDPTRGVPVK